MAAWFDEAASQGLDNMAYPLSTFPQSWGAWVYPVVVSGSGVQCVLSATGCTIANYATVYIDNAALWTIEKTGGGVVTCGTALANEWHYVFIRFLTATSIRASVMNGRTGACTHANNTTAGTMTGIDTFSIANFQLSNAAPTNFFGGGVAELFITNTNAHDAVGVQTDNTFMKKLAFDHGPLWMPGQKGISNTLLDYRSFRSSPEYPNGDEVVSGSRGMQNWTNTNGVVNGPHPPLASGYGKVRPTPNLLMV